jgi:RimJ/RimL family protein N-acetyltransferase
MTLSHGPLVALPFNALARRADTPDRKKLWQLAFDMLAEQDEEYSTLACPRSICDLYYDRFQYEGWKLENIRRRPSTFLNRFTRQRILTESHGLVTRRFWFVFDHTGEKCVGEFFLWNSKSNPTQAQGHDSLRASCRGQGLGQPLFELKLKTAASLGYARYRATIHHTNKQSYRRLEVLRRQGLATRGDNYWVRGRDSGRSYWIDLAKFR